MEWVFTISIKLREWLGIKIWLCCLKKNFSLWMRHQRRKIKKSRMAGSVCTLFCVSVFCLLHQSRSCHSFFRILPFFALFSLIKPFCVFIFCIYINKLTRYILITIIIIKKVKINFYFHVLLYRNSLWFINHILGSFKCLQNFKKAKMS